MKIQHTRSWHVPIWVFSSKLEELWGNDKIAIKKWEGDPDITWFNYDNNRNRIAFLTADMSLLVVEGKIKIYFTNGRHRTRWLLQQGFELIPVGINKESIQFAIKIGLAARIVESHEVINVF